MRSRARAETKIERLNTAFTEGGLSIDEFKELKNPLIPEKTVLEQRLMALEKSKAQRLEPLRQWISEANSLEKAVQENNWREMTSFLKRVGSNRILRAQTVTVSFLKPWASLAETNLAARADNEFTHMSDKWWRWWELNPRATDLRAPRLPVIVQL